MTATEKHFSPQELAEAWGLHADTVRRMFEAEPGVIVLNNGPAKLKRRHRTLRIPESVMLRVHRRLQNG